MNLQGKKILLGVTGSIAAYKSILLVRLLVKHGAEVKVILSPSAEKFVSPLVLETLSKNDVLQEISTNSSWANHVQLGRWADVMVVAPATCNTIAKMAHGFCDNLLLAVYLSATCKVLVAPAMDEDMWFHPTTQENITKLESQGVRVATVESGELGSGLVGMGRMQEPENLLLQILEITVKTNDLIGKNVLITAGGTHEKIDPVRFIGNNSSGKMGIALAEALYLRGANVQLVLGPTPICPKFAAVSVHNVVSASEMFEAVKGYQPSSDIIICAAAVADFAPVNTQTQKIKKEPNQSEMMLVLTKTPDILAFCGVQKKANQLLVGFALETHDAITHAKRKLEEKKADAIVLNSPTNNSGFNTDTNEVVLLAGGVEPRHFSLASKQEIAHLLSEQFIKMYGEKN